MNNFYNELDHAVARDSHRVKQIQAMQMPIDAKPLEWFVAKVLIAGAVIVGSPFLIAWLVITLSVMVPHGHR